ncbi:MAG: zinc metallopeptidase [Eubacterium sp.]|jgi:Zn-dependent membrane protease YugP|nr:zinc metallopeptidase [Eubacterium sp.]
MKIIEYLINNYFAATILVVIATAFAMIMSANVSGTFNKYNRIKSRRGCPAHKIARQILDSNGLYNIEVTRVGGNLTDHYDPKNHIIALSDSVYDSVSIAAIGVTAHECGHAVQHSMGYVPIRIRNAIFPVVNIASRSWFWLFLLGMLFSFPFLTEVGIVFFALAVVFQIITLPVEFDASRRAMGTISAQNLLDDSEMKGARKTLSAAAMTYVAGLMVSIAQLIRLLASSNRRR